MTLQTLPVYPDVHWHLFKPTHVPLLHGVGPVPHAFVCRVSHPLEVLFERKVKIKCENKKN